MEIKLLGIAFPLRWEGVPVSCRTEANDKLIIGAGNRTDLFIDPAGGEPVLNVPRLLGLPPEGDFQLRARVTVDFAETYDAGVLLLWAGERSWAKLCFERSPQGEPTVVSVVNRGVSDDANGFTVAVGEPIWLRISRHGPAWAFHASTDGTYWRLVRLFSLDAGTDQVRVGFEAQSPLGAGCQAAFEHIALTPGRLSDLRGGQ